MAEKRNLYCQSCDATTCHEYIGTQKGFPKGPLPLWNCTRCHTTNSGPEPGQPTVTDLDQTLHDASYRGQ